MSRINGIQAHNGNESASSGSSNSVPPAPAPPVMPPTRVSDTPQARVMYEFNSAHSNELDMSAGDVLDILHKEGNGK